jgi:alpha-ketoglutarate-dependent taurine dioxygenase
MDFDRQRHSWSAGFVDAVARGDLAGAAANAERTRVRELVVNHVDDGAGFLVMTGLGPLPSEAYERALLWFSGSLGDVLPQDSAGTTVRHVLDRGTAVGEGESARYADSRQGGHLHTDGAERAFPVPDYFALCCVRAAKRGGALRVVSVDRVRERLSTRTQILDTLQEGFHFDRRGDELPNQPATAYKPVLFNAVNGKQAVTYLRKYIEVGHSRPGTADLSDDQREALDAFDAALYDEQLGVEGMMRPGEIAVFNNLRILHGRTDFEDYPEPERRRLLYRTWIQRAETRFEPVGS